MVLLPPCNLVLGNDKVMVFNSAPWTFVDPEENKQAWFWLLFSVGQTQPDLLVATFFLVCFLQRFQVLLVIVTAIVPMYLQFSKLHI